MSDPKVSTSRFNFTKKSLEALPTPAEGRAVYWDSGVRGLGLKIQSSGHRCYFWSRKANGKLEWKTLGEFADLAIDEARARASEMNVARDAWRKSGFVGSDPFARPESKTLGELVAAYVDRHVRKHAARPDSAAKNIEWQMERYVTRWRDRKIREIRRADMVALHGQVHEKYGIYAANRVIQLLRAALNWTLDAGLWSGQNPTTGIKMFRETKRRRFLLAPEMAALKAALEAKETTPDLRDYVLLALFTGARKNDLLSMRWENVSLDGATWLVPQSKNQEPYYIALTGEAVRILAERKASAERLQKKTGAPSPWVFPSHGKSGHLTDLKKAWKLLLQRAKIADLRQHDLRRTLGSWQAAGGASLTVIGKSLGHKSIGSTSIYAQLDLDPVRASVEAATAAMRAAMQPKLLPTAPMQLPPAAPKGTKVARG